MQFEIKKFTGVVQCKNINKYILLNVKKFPCVVDSKIPFNRGGGHKTLLTGAIEHKYLYNRCC